jgi:hypothetical protein
MHAGEQNRLLPRSVVVQPKPALGLRHSPHRYVSHGVAFVTSSVPIGWTLPERSAGFTAARKPVLPYASTIDPMEHTIVRERPQPS